MATVLLLSAFLIISFTCGHGLRSYMSRRRYAADLERILSEASRTPALTLSP